MTSGETKDPLDDLELPPDFDDEFPQLPSGVADLPRHLRRTSLRAEEALWDKILSSPGTPAIAVNVTAQDLAKAAAKLQRQRFYHARTYLMHVYKDTDPERVENLSQFGITIEVRNYTTYLVFRRRPKLEIVDLDTL